MHGFLRSHSWNLLARLTPDWRWYLMVKKNFSRSSMKCQSKLFVADRQRSKSATYHVEERSGTHEYPTNPIFCCLIGSNDLQLLPNPGRRTNSSRLTNTIPSACWTHFQLMTSSAESMGISVTWLSTLQSSCCSIPCLVTSSLRLTNKKNRKMAGLLFEHTQRSQAINLKPFSPSLSTVQNQPLVQSVLKSCSVVLVARIQYRWFSRPHSSP